MYANNSDFEMQMVFWIFPAQNLRAIFRRGGQYAASFSRSQFGMLLRFGPLAVARVKEE
jgi:hypothetical protein